MPLPPKLGHTIARQDWFWVMGATILLAAASTAVGTRVVARIPPQNSGS